MRELFFEKTKKNISKKDLINLFEKNIVICNNYDFIKISDGFLSLILRKNGAKFLDDMIFLYFSEKHISIRVGNESRDQFKFDLLEVEYRKAKRMAEERLYYLNKQRELKNKENTDIIKSFLTF